MDAELFERASAVRQNAHAPYSHFLVGAALRTEDGAIFAGANVENASFPEGWCAETSALGQMISQASTASGRRVAAITVVADRVDGGIVCTPCGGCRQRLKEFSTASTVIECVDPTGKGQTFSISDLLPASFFVETYAP
ncbi:cytidine deaminase [Kaistia dalseonensis]|uniref:Cytidine deaminase n=1 Tax=Kaistia dalseonensis TaxID=410840 RepID=A0ABU0H5P0_9HYPH|nr:cytidine deaminase [Kaistia dalseonensis]MCX5495049.1 cytidine deaminase [Kaistia dalseonensis]MDQ0437631.1 cytidine deaminase [Kaistia dalseonensis]